ncbi:MAG: hypothetical protein NC217_08025 [Muribaculaceae bacterium]|nr:hypothetical protein [Muribaculaceae bacterium]
MKWTLMWLCSFVSKALCPGAILASFAKFPESLCLHNSFFNLQNLLKNSLG